MALRRAAYGEPPESAELEFIAIVLRERRDIVVCRESCVFNINSNRRNVQVGHVSASAGRHTNPHVTRRDEKSLANN